MPTTKCTLKSKMSYRIKRGRRLVYLREDFADLGGYSQIGRALRQLVQEGLLIKIGQGLYVKTRPSTINPTKRAITASFKEVSREALTRLGIKWRPNDAELAYNDGSSTQNPRKCSGGLRVADLSQNLLWIDLSDFSKEAIGWSRLAKLPGSRTCLTDSWNLFNCLLVNPMLKQGEKKCLRYLKYPHRRASMMFFQEPGLSRWISKRRTKAAHQLQQSDVHGARIMEKQSKRVEEASLRALDKLSRMSGVS